MLWGGSWECLGEQSGSKMKAKVALGRVLGGSWDRLGRVLGGLGGVPGASWRVPGASWGLWEPSEGIGEQKYHAPERLGLHFGRRFRSKIDQNSM